MSPVARRRTLIIVAVMAATIAAQMTADWFVRRKPVTCGNTILFAGEYYLSDDCTADTRYGIKISENNVILDLNGHTITCAKNGRFGVIIGKHTDIRIHDGTIRDCRFGVTGGQAQNATVDDMVFDNIAGVSLTLKGTDNTIKNSTFKNLPANSYGIHGTGDRCTITGNRFENYDATSAPLLELTIGKDCVVKNNRFIGE